MFPTNESKKTILIKCSVFFCWTSTRTRQSRTDPAQTLFEEQAKKKESVEEKNEKKSAKKNGTSSSA